MNAVGEVDYGLEEEADGIGMVSWLHVFPSLSPARQTSDPKHRKYEKKFLHIRIYAHNYVTFIL